ncbi:MAG TPA: molybdenum cofactor guanylyltransferase [Thermoanaerobaculia bacterium]|nr:molybdenum cofactor guanylyltransferase [Thermoanaerobaculia bacterium]
MNAYVLVGGRSSRMGASKTAMFLDRIVAAARPVFDEVIAVDRPRVIPSAVEGPPTDERGRGSLDCARDDTHVRTIFEDAHDDEGAIFGVARALRDANAKAFIIAVDYPLITAEVLRFLRDREGVPEWNGHAQPLCCVWSVELLPLIGERIAARRYDLRDVGGREMIPESELRARFRGEPLMNVNTPEEWDRAQGFLASR